jgi:multidrug efflux pump subunit AcrA (membrane-fusion protein)
MSTQQQIDAYQSAIDQKQEELAGQEFTLRVLQEDLAKAEQASSAARRAQGPRSEATAAQRQAVRDAEAAESNARIAASQTSDNIAKLQGSIRYNTAQKQSFEASRNAQPAPTSTVGDNPVNVASNAAEVTPAPMPVESTAQPPVVPSEQERTRLAAEAAFNEDFGGADTPEPVEVTYDALGNEIPPGSTEEGVGAFD